MLTTSALVDRGVPTIWAKATNERHGRVLERTGAHHVVYPEARMGERVAHMVTGRMIDYIEFDDDFAIAKTRAPVAMASMTLGESAIRSNHGVDDRGHQTTARGFHLCPARYDVRRRRSSDRLGPG